MKLSCWTTTAWANSHGQQTNSSHRHLLKLHFRSSDEKLSTSKTGLSKSSPRGSYQTGISILPGRMRDVRWKRCLPDWTRKGSNFQLVGRKTRCVSSHRGLDLGTPCLVCLLSTYLQSAEEEMQIWDAVEDLLQEETHRSLSILSKPNLLLVQMYYVNRFISTGGGRVFYQLMGTRNNNEVDGSFFLFVLWEQEKPLGFQQATMFKTCQFSNHYICRKHYISSKM